MMTPTTTKTIASTDTTTSVSANNRASVEASANNGWAEKGLGSVRRGRDSERYPGGVTALNTEKLSTDNVYEATLPLRTQSWAGCQPERGCPNGTII